MIDAKAFEISEVQNFKQINKQKNAILKLDVIHQAMHIYKKKSAVEWYVTSFTINVTC